MLLLKKTILAVWRENASEVIPSLLVQMKTLGEQGADCTLFMP
jgi:hypothetical protein